MLDPFPPPPPGFAALAAPLAKALNFSTLPLHIHEIIFAGAMYMTVNLVVAPRISRLLFPKEYAGFNRRTKISWDVHIMSLYQSVLVCALALWVMWNDKERANMDWEARVWGYTGASGMIQAFAAGYFLWDLYISVVHVDVFGYAMLAHAISAISVFSLGFRPFVNFYAPTFILYELSSPFLNFHWFFDKINMTGSKPQWYNGMALIFTFLCCRLIWGTYQSLRVYQDVMAAIQKPGAAAAAFYSSAGLAAPEMLIGTERSTDAGAEVMRFAGERAVPMWLAFTYLGANITLNTLNFYWFGKMIETVRKRFRSPPADASGAVSGHGPITDGDKIAIRSARVEMKEGADGAKKSPVVIMEETEVTENRRRPFGNEMDN